MNNKVDVSNNIFIKLYEYAFKKKQKNLGVKKLSGGLKNRVYLLDDGKKKYVLKTEPASSCGIAPIDKNTLWWEAHILEELGTLNIPIPKVLFYSDGIPEFEHPFLIISFIEGNNYNECKENLTISQKKEISYMIGKINSKICSIKKDYYYIPSFKDKIFNNNYELVLYMFESILPIYKKNKINIEGITAEEIIKLVKSKKKNLMDVNNISLCNIDLWDGNILVKNGTISGIVDFTDTFYCDELMSFYFHKIDEEHDEYFLLGYNNKSLNYSEKVRIEIYRLYVLLKMIIDCEIKGYGRFGTIYKDFIEQYKKITCF